MYVCLLYVASGLRKLVFGNFSYAMGEFYRGIYKAAQVKELQKFVPSLKTSDVIKFVPVSFQSLLSCVVIVIEKTGISVIAASLCQGQ